MAELSIAALADRCAVPVTTIRMYQQRRLLDPPERRGRVGVYTDAHVERLELIARLQARGYSLAAIADLLQRDESGIRSLVSDEVPSLAKERPITLTLQELVAQLPSPDFTLQHVERASELGLVRLTADGIVAEQPSFLDVGATLLRLGVPPTAVLDAYERLRGQLGVVADDFVALFDEHVTAGAEDLTEAGAQLERLADAAMTVVVSELRRALRERAEDRLTALRAGAQPGAPMPAVEAPAAPAPRSRARPSRAAGRTR